MAIRAHLLLANLAQTVPNTLMESILSKMDSNDTFIFTDKPLVNFDNRITGDASGFYSPETKRVYLELNNPFYPSSPDANTVPEKTLPDEESLRHEFMHAVDYLLLDNGKISDQKTFQDIYQKYKDNADEQITNILKKEINIPLKDQQITNMIGKILHNEALTKEESFELQNHLENNIGIRITEEKLTNIKTYISNIMNGGSNEEKLIQIRDEIEKILNEEVTDDAAEEILPFIEKLYLPEENIRKIKDEIRKTFPDGSYQYSNSDEFWAVLAERYFSSIPQVQQKLEENYHDVFDFIKRQLGENKPS